VRGLLCTKQDLFAKISQARQVEAKPVP